MRRDPYKNIATDYDQIFHNRDEIEYIREILSFYHPKAGSILELGCGTGALLHPFANQYRVSGLDSSKSMLSRAVKGVPKGKFYLQDMSCFKITETFDVILCLFNSINHLTRFREWQGTFRSAAQHLNKGGVFIFDMITQRAILNCAGSEPVIQRDEKKFMITRYNLKAKDCLAINFSIFSKQSSDNYKLRESEIVEKSYPIKKVTMELKKSFDNIVIVDPDRRKVTSQSTFLYFICKNKK